MNIQTLTGRPSKQIIWALVAFHSFILALSNILITMPLTIFGFPLTWSAFSFPLIVVTTDLTIRLINKKNARAVINIAFAPALILSCLVIFLNHNSIRTAIQIGIASGCSYLMSNLLDVYVFQKVRERFHQWWAAPFGSSIMANLIDTMTFFAVAFYHSNNAFMQVHWAEVALNQTGTKIIISTAVVLPLYGILLKILSSKMKLSFSIAE